MSAQLAIIIWFVLVTGVTFYFSQQEREFMKNVFADLLVKRTLFMVSVYMMALTGGVVLQIAAAASLTAVNREITTFILILTWTGYGIMVYTSVRTLFDVFKLNQDIIARKRGYDE